MQAELLRLVTAGSVDDGKSTLIGRLLYDTKQILADQLEHIEETSQRRGDGYVNLALLTDGLRAEREQGITIDVAYRSFVTAAAALPARRCARVTSSTRATWSPAPRPPTSMVILVDARNGVIEQTRRHSYIASMLSTPHIVFAVNKMDLVDFSPERFSEIEADLQELGRRLDLHDPLAIPMSALRGDNVVDRTDAMPWYEGPTLLEHLESIEVARRPQPLRSPLPGPVGDPPDGGRAPRLPRLRGPGRKRRLAGRRRGRRPPVGPAHAGRERRDDRRPARGRDRRRSR